MRTDRLQAALERLGCRRVEDHGSLPVPVPEDAGDPRARYLKEIAETCEGVGRWVREQHRAGRFPLVMGGDHSIAAGTVAGTAAALRDSGRPPVGLIWIDAHADLNTPETTPTGHVHGMALAALLGLGPPALTDILGFSPKVDPRQCVLLGVRDVDREEWENIARTGVRIITMRELDERGMFGVMREALALAATGTGGFHLSFDMDALDPAVAPGVATPVPGGLTYREAHLAMEMIAESGGLLSMDMVEVNPVLDREGLTARVSHGLIGSALGKTILPPRLG